MKAKQKIQPSMFNATVGEGITAWAQVEHALLDLFARTVVLGVGGSIRENPQSLFTMGAIFFTPTNFETRLKMVDAAVQTTIRDASLLASWKKLHSKIGKRQPIRNQLSHYIPYGNDVEGLTVMAPHVLAKTRKYLKYPAIKASASSFRDLAKKIQ